MRRCCITSGALSACLNCRVILAYAVLVNCSEEALDVQLWVRDDRMQLFTEADTKQQSGDLKQPHDRLVGSALVDLSSLMDEVSSGLQR